MKVSKQNAHETQTSEAQNSGVDSKSAVSKRTTMRICLQHFGRHVNLDPCSLTLPESVITVHTAPEGFFRWMTEGRGGLLPPLEFIPVGCIE